jgi:2,3-bisphosphoglycerate-independent phosphoglycerate mutase
MPDHPTPISLRTHTSDPVPYLLFDNRNTEKQGDGGFCEIAVKQRSNRVHPGYTMLDRLCGKE